jgi:hypothetical protein
MPGRSTSATPSGHRCQDCGTELVGPAYRQRCAACSLRASQKQSSQRERSRRDSSDLAPGEREGEPVPVESDQLPATRPCAECGTPITSAGSRRYCVACKARRKREMDKRRGMSLRAALASKRYERWKGC